MKTSPCLPARVIEEPELAAVSTELELPAGAELFDLRFSVGPDKSGMKIVLADLCVPDANTVDDLRSAASFVARSVKDSQVGKHVGTIYVTGLGSPEIKYRSYLVDENFQVNPWDNSVSQSDGLLLWEIYEQP